MMLYQIEKKNADMMVANNLKSEGSGFGTDTNQVTFITEEGVFPEDLKSKEMVAVSIFDRILEMQKKEKRRKSQQKGKTSAKSKK